MLPHCSIYWLLPWNEWSSVCSNSESVPWSKPPPPDCHRHGLSLCIQGLSKKLQTWATWGFIQGRLNSEIDSGCREVHSVSGTQEESTALQSCWIKWNPWYLECSGRFYHANGRSKAGFGVTWITRTRKGTQGFFSLWKWCFHFIPHKWDLVKWIVILQKAVSCIWYCPMCLKALGCCKQAQYAMKARKKERKKNSWPQTLKVIGGFYLNWPSEMISIGLLWNVYLKYINFLKNVEQNYHFVCIRTLIWQQIQACLNICFVLSAPSIKFPDKT